MFLLRFEVGVQLLLPVLGSKQANQRAELGVQLYILAIRQQAGALDAGRAEAACQSPAVAGHKLGAQGCGSINQGFQARLVHPEVVMAWRLRIRQLPAAHLLEEVTQGRLSTGTVGEQAVDGLAPVYGLQLAGASNDKREQSA